jgi:hypothetical protein
MVPVSVDALVVPAAPVKAVSLAPRLGLFARGYRLGGLLRAEPWEPDQAIDLAPGVHLHWQLPAALTHGEQVGGDVEFPAVPDRWLLLRVAPDDSPPEWTRAWVVQSDALGRDGANATVARKADGAYVATRIGRDVPYDGPWEAAPAERADRLTAVGPGHPTFAAFYPGCRNVFGFHDTLEGVDRGDFLYLVAGWYGRREHDPLGAGEGPAAVVERRRAVAARWLDGAAIQGPPPTRTVCHGTLHGVTWRRGDVQSAAAPAGARYRLAVGNTAVEALAALVAAPAERGHLWEPLLSAFQYDVLANLDVSRGMPDLDAELHRRRFQAVDGGTEWIVRPVEKRKAAGKPAAATPVPDERPRPPFPTDPEIAGLFDALVDAQRSRDGLDRDLASLRAEYHAAWYRGEQPGSPDRPRLAARLAALEQAIRATAGVLFQVQGVIDGLCGRLQARGLRVPAATAAGTPPGQPDHELVATPMPWFWRPTDPAMLLAAPGDPRAHRYGGARLACRVVEQVVAGLSTVLNGQEVSVTTPGREFPLAPRAGSSMPFDEIAALFRESLLLDPARAGALAVSAYARIGSRQGADSPFVQELRQKILAAQRDPGGGRDVKVLGAVPAHGLASWQPRWDPLFVVWEAEWAPSSGGADPTREWRLHDNTDYRWAGDGSGAPAAARRYRGWAPLSLSLSRQLQERLRDAPGEVAGAFGAWTFFTQSGAGLTDALIMREETLQLPPLRSDGTVDQRLLDLFGAASRWSPLFADDTGQEGFFPVRSGHVRITRLVLVDGFGRAQALIDTDDPHAAQRAVVVGEALRDGDGRPAPWIALPPRIAQPARLLARWVSVADERQKRYRESTSNPATSPILGWIVPDHLDGSLLVCDAGGRLLGELGPGAAGPVWRAVPGPGEDAAATPSLAGAPRLQAFVDGLVRAGAGALEALLELIDRVSLCLTTPRPQPAQGPGLVVGQPLALARASLALEVWGRRATDQRATDAATEETGGLGAVRFPVRLGDVRRSADGLIGCYVGTDYGRILPAFAAPAPRRGQTYVVPDGDLTVSLDAGRVDVTLLLDPRGTVHVTSGILPAGVLELPGPLVTETLERMELSIRVGPVLGSDAAFRVPVPDDLGGSWIWLDHDRTRTPPWQADAEAGKPEPGPGVPARALGIRDGWLSFRRAENEPQ